MASRRTASRLALFLPALTGLVLLCSAAERPPNKNSEPDLTDAERDHWAFRAPLTLKLPVVRSIDRLETPIDAFILRGLEGAGLNLAPPAGRATLLRRVTFDLTGLPPTPAELASFVGDCRSDAYERVVERLLASPHHGEHWAQHWLDVARYAESNGYEADAERPHAWRYRDYVIRAFNDDKPYDRFIVEQLAGDELAQRRGSAAAGPRAADLLVASGFNRCGPVHLVGGNSDPDVNRQEMLTEMTGSVGSTFLGLTIGCARCHNHKFDPISQADYYRLQAFFAAAQPADVDISSKAERSAHDRQSLEIKRRMAPLVAQVAAIDAPYRRRLTEEKTARLEPAYRAALAVAPDKRSRAQARLANEAATLTKVTWDEVVAALSPSDRAKRTALRSRIHSLEAQLPEPPPHAWTVKDQAIAPSSYVLVRGDPKRKGQQVWPALPRILSKDEKGTGTKQVATSRQARDDKALISSGMSVGAPGMCAALYSRPVSSTPRLDLARGLTRPDHPLTARVMVNRLWQYHFGRGLVATPNDFGFRGEPPSNPELLDWLAREFVAGGWSVKHMHRLMVLSSTYRQAGRYADRTAQKIDPENRLLWHMPRQRLAAEVIRDAALAAANTLNPKMAGPMIRIPLEPEVYEQIFTEGEPDGLWLPHPDRREHSRRTIYLFAKRNVRLPLLEAFDRPDSLTSCPVRPVSTFAPQALILMNGPFAQEQSRRFACRLLRECGRATDRQIDFAYRLALGRPPRTVEQATARRFLAEQAALLQERLRACKQVNDFPELGRDYDPAETAALADFCLALLNCNEFVYVN